MSTSGEKQIAGRLRDFAQYLLARRGEFVSRQELLVNVFNHPADSKSRTVDTHVQRLLKLLGDEEEILSVRSRQRNGFILVDPERPMKDEFADRKEAVYWLACVAEIEARYLHEGNSIAVENARRAAMQRLNGPRALRRLESAIRLVAGKEQAYVGHGTARLV